MIRIRTRSENPFRISNTTLSRSPSVIIIFSNRQATHLTMTESECSSFSVRRQRWQYRAIRVNASSYFSLCWGFSRWCIIIELFFTFVKFLKECLLRFSVVRLEVSLLSFVYWAVLWSFWFNSSFFFRSPSDLFHPRIQIPIARQIALRMANSFNGASRGASFNLSQTLKRTQSWMDAI